MPVQKGVSVRNVEESLSQGQLILITQSWVLARLHCLLKVLNGCVYRAHLVGKLGQIVV